MKKLFMVLLSILLFANVFFVSSCAKPEEKEEGEYVEGVTVKGNDVYYGDSKEGKERILISFVEKGYGRRWLLEIAKRFVKDHPEYYIFVDGDPNLTASISTKLQSGRNLSDIFMPLGSMWEDYVFQGYIEPITDVYRSKCDGEEGGTVLDKMSESWKTYGYLKSQIVDDYFIMPWNENVTGLVYNVKLFEKYGWSIPSTTDELYTLCGKILSDTKGAVKPFVYPGSIGGYFDFLGGTWWMQSAGYDGMTQFFGFDSAEVFDPAKQPSLGRKQGLEEFQRFFGPGAIDFSVSGSMSKNHITAQMDFLRGNAAMIPNASWMEREMIDSLPKDFEMKMMSVPFLKTAQKDADGNMVQCNYATAPDYMFIPKKAANVKGAKKFLTYMCNDDMLKLYTKYTSSPRPFDYDVSDIPNLSSFAQSVLKLSSASDKYFVFSKHPAYLKSLIRINGDISDPYASIVFGEKTAKKVVDSIYLYALDNWTNWMSDANV